MRPPRRLAVVLAAVAAGAAAPRTARAQFQACAAGTLDTYSTLGFSCLLGSFDFLAFQYDASGTGASGSGTATAPDPADVGVTPFVGTDAKGRTTFGFNFTNLAATAGVPGGAAGTGSAVGSFQLGILAVSTSRVISRAGLSLALDAATNTPGRTDLTTGAGGLVFGLAPVPVPCFANGRERNGPTSLAIALSSRCPIRSNVFLAAYEAEATAERGDSPRTQAGSARAELTAVTFTLARVPEPGTVALAAAGLAAVGLAARRRSA